MKLEVLLLEGRYRYGHKGAVKFKPCDPPQVFDDELACAKFMRQIAGPTATMQGMTSSIGEHWLGIWKSPKDCRPIKQGGNALPPPFVVRSDVAFNQKVWESV